MKKKAIKIAAASAVAASAFVAAAPLQSNAASNVTTTVDNAVKQMQVAYHTYSDVTAKGDFADINAVYKQLNAAKAAYASATALVKKAGGAQKDANLAKLDDNYNTYITKRVVTYIDAYNYAVKNLAANQEALQTAIDAKDLDGVQEAYNEISYQLKSRTVILDRVYGQTTRELLRSSFKADAQELRDSMKYDVTVAVKVKAVADAIAAGKLDVAKAAVDQINLYLPKVTDTFKTDLTTKATAAVAAFDATQAPVVAGVSAINNTTVQVTLGGNFKDKTITAADFKVAVEGSDVQIAKFEAGATAGTYTVTIGATLKDGQSVTVTGADDLTGSATAKYATTVVSTAAAVTATYDSTKTEQKLGLKVNGADTTVEALDAEGYEVQFQADKAVFAGSPTVSGNGILDKLALTALVATDNKFKYKVVITKDGAIVAESAQVEVNLFDGTQTATAIQGYKLKQVVGGETITSGKLVSGESADVTDIIASGLIDNRQDVTITRSVTLETSNPFVVSVTQPTALTDGQITAAGTGTATITIKSGTTTKTFTVTVVNEARKITSVSTSDSSIKLARNGVKDVTLTFKDQYGDVMAGQVAGTDYTDSATVANADADTIAATVTDAGADNTSDKGKETVTFTADPTNTGSGTFRVYKPNGTTLLSIPVTVEADTIANTFKLEAANADSVDKILDLNDEEITESNNGNDKIVFNLNQYTAAGSFIGAVATANLDTDKTDADLSGVYSIVVVDNKGEETTTAGVGDAAGITIGANGAITIDTTNLTGAVQDYSKVGTYTIKAYNKDNTLIASTTFTVKDSAPVVSTATFVTNFEINATTASIASLIPDTNIKITGAGGDGKVRVDDSGIVYIDTNNSDALLTTVTDVFEPGIDIYLGQVVVAKKSGTIGAALALDTAGGITTTAGDDGVISVGIQKRGATTPTFVGDFKVKN